jgi:phage terminase large subunit-like protein
MAIDTVSLATERAIRQAARGTFEGWCRYVLGKQDMAPARHHMLFIEKLQRVLDGKTKRLAISAPQGSAKTTYTSILFPPYAISKKPNSLFLHACHTDIFAQKRIGRPVKGLIEEHKLVLDVAIDPESKAMADFSFVDLDGKPTGGMYRCLGVGSAVAGYRADYGLVEDPFPDWASAQSPTTQDDVWGWFEGSFFPRLKPQAPTIIICTRYHQLDLLGRVLARDKELGIEWEYIRLPMLAEDDDPIGRNPGEMLWPEWYTQEQLKVAMSNPQMWIGAWQQRPSFEQGQYFKREWFLPYIKRPPLDELMIYGASDYAVTTKQSSDYTVHVVVGVDTSGAMWLLDLWRKKAPPNESVEAFVEMLLRYRPSRWANERIQIVAALGPYMHERMIARRATATVMESFPTNKGDKQVRCQSIRGKMGMGFDPMSGQVVGVQGQPGERFEFFNGGLRVPQYAQWRSDFENEMCEFPFGAHDDTCDAMGLIGQLLDMVSHGVPKKPDPTPIKMFSTDPSTCNVTLEDLFEACVPQKSYANPRIR